MSESVLLAGKRGSGKSLGAIAKAGKYLASNRMVATNLNLYVEHLVPAYCRQRWVRVPDHPTAADLKVLPLGNRFLEWRAGQEYPVMLPGYKESANGLLLLDEAATFLNSREWNGSGRQDVISWLLHSRKFGWDLLFLAQHGNLLDKQIRDALIEIQGTVRRMDKIQVPVLSTIWKYFTSEPLHFPKIHVAALRYGWGVDAPVADRWFWRGTELYAAYDTLQQISGITGQQGTSMMLSAWELKGQFMNKWDLRRQMAAGGLVIGVLLGFAGGYLSAKLKPAAVEVVAETVDATVKVKGSAQDADGRQVVLLTDGRAAVPNAMQADDKGQRYLIGKTWYGVQ